MTARIIAVLTVAGLLAGCGESVDPNEPQGFIQVKGSDTIVNAVQQVAEEFMKRRPHVFIAVTGGGSGVGIASLINQTCDVADASREMKPKEVELAEKRGVYPKEITVAYDGVAVIVNRRNPIDRLTIEDLHNIFTGKITNWKQLSGGRDVPIVTLSREVSSGTHMYFKEVVIQLSKSGSTEEFSSNTLLLTSSQAIVEEVAGNQGAIGYLGMGYLSDRTKPVQIGKTSEAFYPPDMRDVLKKTYPLSRGLYMYTDGEPQGVVKLFIDFTLGPAGQSQFMDAGFVPVGETLAQKAQ